MSHAKTPVEQEEEHTNNHGANQVCSVCNNKRPNFGWKRDFTYAELHAATQGFSPKNFLAEGGFGSVYKGELHGVNIAVKQHRDANPQGEKEFKSEVDAVSKARHDNVVMLLGSCSERKNRLLVYEYVCNGSLDQHFSPHARQPLCWKDRLKVSLGAAKGLLYLHENNIIHRDMTPNNILVTHDYEALLGDFGLARIVPEESSHLTACVGNLPYCAPEYIDLGEVSNKTDVYSFGVVLLQLITGMRTTDKRLRGKSLVGWARPLLREGKYSALIDGRMMNSHDCHQLHWMTRLASNCLNRDPQKRLTMHTVVNALSHIVKGSCCSNIVQKDLNPAMSDSSHAMSGSSKSKGDTQGSSAESQCNVEI